MKWTRRTVSKRRKTRRRRGGAGCTPRPEDVYSNQMDTCPALCDKTGAPLPDEKLSLKLSADSPPAPDIYIYVIRESEPETIYYTRLYWLNDPEKFWVRALRVCPGEPVRDPRFDESMYTLHHTCIANNKRVLAAGEFAIMDGGHPKTLYFNVRSGHYLPRRESLDYVQCLVEEMGYTFVRVMHERDMRELFLKLSYGLDPF